MCAKLSVVDNKGELLPKVKRFCEYYSQGSGSVNECMVMAQFSQFQAQKYGKDILAYPEVKAYMDVIDDNLCMEAVAGKEEVLRFWTEIMNDDTVKVSDRLNASKLLGQYLNIMNAPEKVDNKPIIIYDIKPEGDTNE